MLFFSCFEALQSLSLNISHGLMGSENRYGKLPTSNFLEGEHSWWNRSLEDGSVVPSNVQEKEMAEIPTWINWRRQRLKPVLKYWLIPSAWSPAFFLAGLISISLDQINDFPAELGLILMLICPLSLGSTLIFLASKSDDGDPLVMLIALISRSRGIWLVLLVFLSVWLVEINPSNENPVWFLIAIPAFVLWFEWFTLGTAAHTYPSSRWLLPVKYNSLLPISELEKRNWNWISDSDKVRKGKIAKLSHKLEGYLLLSVIHYSGTYFLTLEWWSKFGTRIDPWLFESLLTTPPLNQFRKLLKLELNIGEVQKILHENTNDLWENCKISWPEWSESMSEDE